MLRADSNDDVQTFTHMKYSGKVSPKDRQRPAKFVYIKCSASLKNGSMLSRPLVTLMFYGGRSEKEEEVHDIPLRVQPSTRSPREPGRIVSLTINLSSGPFHVK